MRPPRGDGGAPGPPGDTPWRGLVGGCGVAVALIGLAGLAGWWFDIDRLESVASGLATMKPDTAVSLLLAGLALWRQRSGSGGAIATAFAAAVALVAGVTAFEYASGWRVVAIEPADPEVLAGGSLPGRMSAAAAAGLTLAALALLALDRRAWIAASATLGCGGIAAVALIGYAYDVGALYRFGPFSTIALHTALALLILSVGLSFARPGMSPFRLSTTAGVGPALLRRLLPWAIGVPVVTGWLTVAGERAGLFAAELGTALLVLANVALLLSVISATARYLVTMEARLSQAADRNRLFSAVVESTDDAIVVEALDGTITGWNAAAERLYGYSAAEALGRSSDLIVPPERREKARSLLERVARGERVEHHETLRQTRDGAQIEVSMSLSPVRDHAGTIVAGVTRDVTAARQAEERFRIAVEACPSGMIMVDPGGAIVLTNAETERLFGYARDELLGRPVECLVPERWRDGHRSLRAAFSADPVPRPMGAGRELHGLRKDGSEFPLEIALNPVPTREGVLVLGSIIDLTERRRSESWFRGVVEAAPTAMLMVDPEGRITLVNRRSEELFGYHRTELVGREVELLIPERFRDRHPGHVEGFFANPQFRAMGAGRELFGLRKDGTEVPIEIGLNPIDTADGPFTLANIIDITERRRGEDELRRSNAELEQFAYVASHDLQEPLRMVASYTALLAQKYEGALDAKADKYIHYAVDGAKRMQALVSDLLAYSRVGSQGKPLLPVDSGAVVRDVVKSLERVVAESGGSVVAAEPLPTVFADAGQLRQLFQNLIGNALKFKADRPPRVVVTARPQEPHWLFSVEDNGIGIEQRFEARVFQMFQRLHEVGRYEGSGIGLAISKRIIERHGGTIWLESKLGEGTTFFFTLAGAPVEASSRGADETGSAAAGRGQPG